MSDIHCVTIRQSGSFQEETFVDKVVDRLDSPPRSREDSLNPKVERSTSLGSKVTVLAPPQVSSFLVIWHICHHCWTTFVTHSMGNESGILLLQVLITEGSSLEDVEEDLEAVGVGFPLVVKSQFADGREGSHLLAVVHDRCGSLVCCYRDRRYRLKLILFNTVVSHAG